MINRKIDAVIEQRRRSSLVTVLVLHGRCEPGVCDYAPGRHQAGAPRHSQGRSHPRT